MTLHSMSCLRNCWPGGHHAPVPLTDRGPLRVLFTITSMPVGGAETLLMNLIRRMNRERFLPEVCCLKEPGPLGEELTREIPVHSRLLNGKFDLRVFPRLTRLIRRRGIDALVTVGAGDKMFWGRLAAWWRQLPVVVSALHSTGWPDGVGRLNRRLTPLTDAFIACANEHGRFLVEHEHFPVDKVRVISNGVDVDRFRRCESGAHRVRRELGISPDSRVCGIVAALRPEKNHELFLRAAAIVLREVPHAVFLIVGDGPRRPNLVALAKELGIDQQVRFLGTRGDIPDVLSLMDVFALTSHNEANPVSILEAMACETPVVATRVGSVAESVRHRKTGFLVAPGSADPLAGRLVRLLTSGQTRRDMGQAARRAVVENWSLDHMVRGYEDLIRDIYQAKCGEQPAFREKPVSDMAPESEDCLVRM
jgi:glycosyltransferase involved in cell wall biosynthesis